MSLKRSFMISFGKSGGSFLLHFASNIILARLLLPSEIGLFSVCVALTAVLHTLRDFGVGRYLIKEKELTDDKVRTVFGVAILIGWSLAALIYLSRGAVADFYNEPQIEALMALLSINFLLLPIGQPAFVLLRRSRLYGRLAGIGLSASFAGASTSVLFAALGHGPFALVYGVLAQSVTTVGLSLYFRPDHILLRPSLQHWRVVCGFGGIVSLATIVMKIGMHMPDLLLGRFLGFAAVGLYSRGYGLAKIFEGTVVGAVGWVTGPEIAARHRSGKGFGELVLKVTDATLVTGWPVLIVLALKAEAIVWLFYGENWLPAVPVVQALCLARGLQLIVSQAPALYEGTGAVGLMLRNEVILVCLSVALLLVGVQYSLEAVAWLRVPLGAAVIVVHLSIFRRFGAIGLRQIFIGTWRSLVVALGVGAALLGLIFLEPAEAARNPLVLAGELAAAGLVYLACLYLVAHPFRTQIEGLFRLVLFSARTKKISPAE